MNDIIYSAIHNFHNEIVPRFLEEEETSAEEDRSDSNWRAIFGAFYSMWILAFGCYYIMMGSMFKK